MNHHRTASATVLRVLTLVVLVLSTWLTPASPAAAAPVTPPPWSWHVEDIQASAVGGGSGMSVAYDSLGQPHVSYIDQTIPALKHAWREAGGWQVETVEAGSGFYTALAIDTEDHFYLAFQSAGTLKFAFYNGTSWSSESVPLPATNEPEAKIADTGNYISLALDDQNNPKISYYDATNYKLVYSTRDTAGWHSETVETMAGKFTSLVLDSAGYPHIAYCKMNGQITCFNINIAIFDGSSWQISYVFPNFTPIDGLSMVLDSTGMAQIAFHNQITQELRLITETPTGWTDEAIDTDEAGRYPSMTIDAEDNLYVAYQQISSGDLRLATRLNGIWDIYTASNVGTLGYGNATTLNPNGMPVIAFNNTAFQHVQFAYPEGQPNLLVTDVWKTGSNLSFQVMNNGLGSTQNNFSVKVYVDTVLKHTQIVGLTINPGIRVTYEGIALPACSGNSDTIEVRADTENQVGESDEGDNILTETWPCDATAPRITSGPTVSAVSTVGATITWTTDDASNSYVHYRKNRHQAYIDAGSAIPVTSHSVTLTGLIPNTTYEFYITSRNNGLLEGSSRLQHFTTLPTAHDVPTSGAVGFNRSAKPWENYTATLQLLDSTGVERVDFYMDGVFLGSDYTLSLAGQYEMAVDPGTQFPIRSAFFGTDHVIEAYSIMEGGLEAAFSEHYTPGDDGIPVEFGFITPEHNDTLYTPYLQMPEDSEVAVSVFAEEYEWGCDYANTSVWNPGGPAITCGDVDKAIHQVIVRLDGHQKYSRFPTSLERAWTFQMDVSLAVVGTHILEIEVTDTAGEKHVKTQYLNIAQGGAGLKIERVVKRQGNYFTVEVFLTNNADAEFPAKVNLYFDYYTGFQGIDREEPGKYTVTHQYDPYLKQGRAFIQIDDSISTLDPGETVIFSYELVPVLMDTMANLDYLKIGPVGVEYFVGELFRLWNSDAMTEVVAEWNGTAWDSVWLRDSFSRALALDDYIIVTNPSKLATRYNQLESNQLFSTMAELAKLKNGVLGYLTREVDDGELLNRLLESGSQWTTRLHPKFNQLEEGYVLLVGESDIVPSFTSKQYHRGYDDYARVHLTDHRYAHTGGTGSPDLNLGRIPGENPAALEKAIRNSINEYLGVSGYEFDHSGIEVVSGVDPRETFFQQSARDVQDIAIAKGFPNDIKHADWDGFVWENDLPYMEHDGYATADYDGNGRDEVIIASRNDMVYVYEKDSNSFYILFHLDFEEGDGFAAGDLNGDGTVEFIHGDRADEIVIYNAQGVELASLNWDFQAFDKLAVGDVMTDQSGMEIVMADRDDRIHIFSWNGGSQLKWKVTTALDTTDIPYEFHDYDLLAVGDVDLAEPGQEIVFSDREADKIVVLNRTAGLLRAIDENLQYGDGMAVGNIYGGSEAEIIHASRDDSWKIFYYPDDQWYGAGHADFEQFDGVEVRMVDGVGEIIDLDRGDKIRGLDSFSPSLLMDRISEDMISQDLNMILYRGHGNMNVWAGTISPNYMPFDFGNMAPVVAGFTCLSGNYGVSNDVGFIEHMFASNAGVVIGATEESASDSNDPGAKKWASYWSIVNQPLGRTWTDLERNRWGADGWWDQWYYWVEEYQYYGDPKFGYADSTVPDLWTPGRPELAPEATISIHLPEYTVTSQDGFDFISIPDDHSDLYAVDRQPRVPVYTITQDYPAGLVVQAVTLTHRDTLTSENGFNLPVNDASLIDGEGNMSAAITPNNTPTATWVPDLPEPFRWQVSMNEDGTSTLTITVYPFTYNPNTLDSTYYQDFTFEVSTISTDVSILYLATDTDTYSTGEPVTFDTVINNAGAAQDVLISAEIRPIGGSEIVGSLDFGKLEGLTGEAFLTQTWTPDAALVGDFMVEISLYDTSSNLLAQATQEFRLGRADGAVTAFTASQVFFNPGDVIALELDFQNTGDTPISGSMVIEVVGPAGDVADTYTQEFVDLAIFASANLQVNWDTAGVINGKYRLNGYVMFESRSTGIETLTLNTQRLVYLPVVRK